MLTFFLTNGKTYGGAGMNTALLLSGGVDSSVALARLCEAGARPTAFYLKIWLEDELSFLGECPWEEDLSYARTVCEQLGVPLEIIPMQHAYHEQIVSYVIAEVKAGRTPNPDILCNQHIKFGAFYFAAGSDYDKVATGHYAQVRQLDGRYRLFCAPDPIKDQTYFLALLSQEQLSKACFPIGHLTKAEVRAEAERLNLPNKQRRDSQGICFLGKLKFTDFIKHHLGERPGKFVEYETGTTVGHHTGYWFYTLGQRQGIGLSGGPWYVVAKDMTENTVFISRQYYTPEKERNQCTIGRCNWICGGAPVDKPVQVKLRHGPNRHDARLSVLAPGQLHVQLADQDQGIAPGQFAVFYDGDECLGGGVIEG
jgi:tRNA-specific 2-thiouridylase